MRRIIYTITILLLVACMSISTAFALDSNIDKISFNNKTNVKDPNLPACNLRDITYSTGRVNISLSETSGVKLYYVIQDLNSTIQDSDWKEVNYNTFTIENEGNYQFYYKVVDSITGLSSISKKYTIYFDRVSPKTPNIHTENSIYDQCLYVSLEARQDSGSPIESMYYRINEGKWYEYNLPIPIDKAGGYKIEAYSIDACGNESAIEKEEVEVKYDNLLGVPSVTRDGASPSNDKITYRIDNYRSYFTYYYQFVSHGSQVKPGNWIKLTKEQPITVSKQGEWDLYIKVEYNKNDVSGRVATCIIDKDAPEIFEAIPERIDDSKYINITVGAHDDYTRELEYSFDGGKTWQLTNTKTFKYETALNVCDVQVKDEAGNIAYLTYGFNIYTKDDKYYAVANHRYETSDNISFNQYARDNGYIVGTGDNKFMPDNKITRAEFATMLCRVINFEESETDSIMYKDVDKSFWGYKYITEVQKHGLIDTGSSRYFEPDKLVTRQEAAYTINKILKTDGLLLPSSNFKDITNSKYTAAINNVNALGLMVGYGQNKFGPTDVLTRAQVVTILNRLIDITDKAGENGKAYIDVPESHWAYKAIFEASI